MLANSLFFYDRTFKYLHSHIHDWCKKGVISNTLKVYVNSVKKESIKMTTGKKYRIGIDVGGTFTDGVLVIDDEVIAKTKEKTTSDVTTGTIKTIDTLLSKSGIDPNSIGLITLSTTHTTNAIIERKGLDRVGIIRLALPTGSAIPPLTGWPSDLKEALGGSENVAMIPGGYNYDGEPIADIDEELVREKVREMAVNVDTFAVTGVFSPIRSDQEETVERIIKEELGDDVPVTLSCEISTISLLERENSAILNASVISVMNRAIDAIKDAMASRDIKAELFIMQNDGSVIQAEYATDYPIFTLASGPAASIRGAVFLTNIKNGALVDVGGTSTDVGYMVDGFPRESMMTVEIGGVKTNIRAPDLTSVPLGGGTIVEIEGNSVKRLGPESVALDLQTLALSYGGPMTTVHDIAVAKGRLTEDLAIFKTPHATHPENAKELDPEIIDKAWDMVKKRVEKTIDEIKTDPEDIPVILVGGGSMVVPTEFAGATKTYESEHSEVAGALGATLAEVAAYAENVVDLEVRDRQEAIDETVQMAIDNVVRNGGDGDSANVLDIQEVPFSYMPGEREKIRVKVKSKFKGI